MASAAAGITHSTGTPPRSAAATVTPSGKGVASAKAFACSMRRAIGVSAGPIRSARNRRTSSIGSIGRLLAACDDVRA